MDARRIIGDWDWRRTRSSGAKMCTNPEPVWVVGEGERLFLQQEARRVHAALTKNYY
jgi:hypothetical protein